MHPCALVGCDNMRVDCTQDDLLAQGICTKCSASYVISAQDMKQAQPEANSAHPDTAYSNLVYENILHEAHTITEGARQQDYGSATESFSRISSISSVLCDKHISARDIVKVLMAVKLVRESFKHKRDNLVDLCGYARLLQDIEDDLANMEPNCKPANS